MWIGYWITVHIECRRIFTVFCYTKQYTCEHFCAKIASRDKYAKKLVRILSVYCLVNFVFLNKLFLNQNIESWHTQFFKNNNIDMGIACTDSRIANK